MGLQLLRCNAISYERDITSWHSQDCLLLPVMAQRGKLLTSNKEEGVLTSGGSGDGGGGGIVQNKGPDTHIYILDIVRTKGESLHCGGGDFD